MAIVFELWAETRDEESLDAVAYHFSDLTFRLHTGATIRWQANRVGAPHYPPAVVVGTRDLSSSGVRSVKDALECTEAGLHLYSHLKMAPAFTYARVDWDPECVPLCELQDYLDHYPDGSCSLPLSCVLADDVYRGLGSPKHFEPFRDGYVWHRYRGETYRPLYSNDQSDLNAICRELFPEYFRY